MSVFASPSPSLSSIFPNHTMLSLKPSILFSLDKIASRAIAIAGPIFIVIAVVLISLAIITYYTVVFPYVFVWDKDYIWSKVNYYLGLIWSIYLTVCIAFHYYMSITTKPGGILIGGTGDVSRKEQKKITDIYIYICYQCCYKSIYFTLFPLAK